LPKGFTEPLTAPKDEMAPALSNADLPA